VNSDKQWIRLGRTDPYLQTVRTLDPYKLDPDLPRDGKSLYFASGERYVADLFDSIGRYVRPGFKSRLAVDFGCSVGRVAIPLARRCDAVIGLDVSIDALDEARRNATRFDAPNVSWLPSDDGLSSVSGAPDLFHSYNVLQHLEVRRGLRIVRKALAMLAPGGVFAIHVPYADRASRLRRAINWTQAHLSGVNMLANVARGRAYDYPHMLMNPYDLAALFTCVAEIGAPGVHCKFVDQGRYPGVLLLGRTGGPVESGANGVRVGGQETLAGGTIGSHS
jgi:SAM-dependent methyltransferase